MAKWDDLPSDLLSKIIQRLHFFDDFVVFGAVCKSWQLVVISMAKPSSPPKFPWLMLAEEKEERDESNSKEENKICKFYSLSATKTYKFILPKASGRKCFGASFGWLLTIGTDLQINLLHPFSKCQIDLPPQFTFSNQYQVQLVPEATRDIFIHKAVLSMAPRKPSTCGDVCDCIIMVICRDDLMLAFTKPGDNAWIHLQTSPRTYVDIVYYKGKFYALDFHGVIFICDIDDDQIPRATAIALPPEEIRDEIQKYLVESSGDLLLVLRIRGGRFYPVQCVDYKGEAYQEDPAEDFYVTIGFTVLKLEQCNQGGSRYSYKWVKVDSLGDQSLFLGDSSSWSFSVSNFNGFKANCIYFMDDNMESFDVTQAGGGYHMGVFNMKDATIKPHYTDRSLSYYSTPLWYI